MHGTIKGLPFLVGAWQTRMSTPSRGPTVLVTDDNRDVVDALAEFLGMSGYKVIATYSAREALDSLDQDASVGVVISDVRMPELDGFDFLRVVRHRFPSIKVILVTGHEITSEDVVPAGATILKKPLEFEQLLKLLQGLD
jgi:DNA-binding NtrC family response regulator